MKIQSLIETLVLLQDEQTIKEIQQSEKEIQQGKVINLEELKEKHNLT